MKGASDVVDLRILVRTALICLAPEAAVDYRRCLQSARRSTVCRLIIRCQSSGLQAKGEGVVPPASSMAEGFCYWRCHGSRPPNAPQLALAPKDRSGHKDGGRVVLRYLCAAYMERCLARRPLA